MEWVATRNLASWPITQMPPMSSPRTRSFFLESTLVPREFKGPAVCFLQGHLFCAQDSATWCGNRANVIQDRQDVHIEGRLFLF